MAFGGLIITNKGSKLQVKAQTGVELVYTRVAMGEGSITTEVISELNSLINEIKSLDIERFKVLDNNKAVIKAAFSNSDVTTGFYFREVGVFAQDPDEGEILYCYGNAGDTAEYIPSSSGSDIVEKTIDITTIIGNAANVSAVINESLVYALKSEVDSKVDKIEGKGLSTQDYTTKEKQKLESIEEGATNYKHPSTHSANIIIQNSERRFVSDNQKANWNDANSKKHIHSNKSILDKITQALINKWDTVTSKVDKIPGKGLSTEDYTTAEKNKLNGIQSGAQVNRGISDSVTSTSTTTNASSKAAKTAYDKAVTALNTSNGKEPKIAKKSGFNLNKSDSITSTSSSTLATSKAVKTAYDKGNSAYSKVTSASYLRDRIKTVDGSGSGLDADLLDGKHINYLENLISDKSKAVVGSYSGDGTSSYTISLGFTPVAVLITQPQRTASSSPVGRQIGLAITGYPHGTDFIKIVTNGFELTNNSYFNNKSETYSYLAIN